MNAGYDIPYIKAQGEILMQTQHRKNALLAESAVLKHHFQKKTDILFPNLRENPESGRIYLQRRKISTTIASIFALSQSTDPNLACESTELYDVFKLLREYSPTTAANYPLPENFKQGMSEHAFTQKDLQALLLQNLQLATIDFDQALSPDSPLLTLNQNLYKITLTHIEKAPRSRMQARGLDLAVNLNTLEADPNQADYLDQIIKAIWSKPKPKFDLSMMKSLAKIPLPHESIVARLFELNLPRNPEQLNATLKHYQQLANILGEMTLLSHHQTGNVKFHDVLYELNAVGYPHEQMSPSLQSFITELTNMQNILIPTRQILQALEKSSFDGGLPSELAGLVTRYSGKKETPLDETRQALQDILDHGLQDHLKTIDNGMAAIEEEKFKSAIQPLKQFLTDHPRASIQIPGNEIQAALANTPMESSSLRDLMREATTGDKVVEYFSLKRRLKDLGKQATPELIRIFEKYQQHMPRIDRAITQPLIENLPIEYRTEMASSFFNALVGKESIPREELLIALEHLPKPLPTEFAVLEKEYSMVVPQRIRFTALLTLTHDLANSHNPTANDQLRELLNILSLDLSELTGDLDISSLDRSLVAITKLIPSLAGEKILSKEQVTAEQALILTHQILYDKNNNDTLHTLDITQLDGIWKLLSKNRSY